MFYIPISGGVFMTNQSDKDVSLIELKKTVTRLHNSGVNTDGIYFGINDNIRKSGKQELCEENEEEQESEGNVLWKPEDEFIKIFPDELNRIAFNLTGAETLTLMRLLCYIDFISGMLKKQDKTPLANADIISITGFSKVTVIEIMDNLVIKRVLSRNKVGRAYQYFANPYIFFKGRYINPTLIAMFKDYKKK
jgi:hypothetical protein